jgi:Putative amidoligase enzyme
MKDLGNLDILHEIDMSPSALRARAMRIPATVGIEFELCVPGSSEEYGFTDQPDLGHDRKLTTDWREQIQAFFTTNNRNDPEKIEGVVSDLNKKIQDFTNKEFLVWLKSADGSYELEGKLTELFSGLTNDEIQNRIIQAIKNKSASYLHCVSELYDDWLSGFDELNFFDMIGFERLSDIDRHYGLEWPFWTERPRTNIEQYRDELQDILQTPVKINENWSENSYGIQQDTSVKCPSGYTNMELQSPPLSLAKMLDHLVKIEKWARDNRCLTNDTTGLHINVSLPDFTRYHVDYIKLVLFLGDKWVLKEFGRLGNKYTESAIEKITNKIKDAPSLIIDRLVPQMLNLMRNHLVSVASKMLHKPFTEKYTSVNVHDNRIEFRSAGGNWLNKDIEGIIDTICRYVTVLELSMDENLERQEYAKKFYKLLAPAIEKSPITDVFLQYSMGQINQQQLKDALKRARMIAKKDSNENS